MPLWRRGIPAVVVAALMVAGCAAGPTDDRPGVPATTTPATAPASTAPTTTNAASSAPAAPTNDSLPRLIVERTGGFAGFRDTLTVEPDGSWAYESERSGASRGRLAAGERRELARLLADPAFATEARQTVPPGDCADALVYTIRTRGLSARLDECVVGGNRPALAAVLDFVLDATPL